MARGGSSSLFFPVTEALLCSLSGMICWFEDCILSLFRVILPKYRLVTLVRGICWRFASPFKSASANGVSLSGPRSDCKGSTVKDEPCAWLRWWELQYAISSLMNVGLFIVLNTTFFFPLCCSKELKCRLVCRWFGWSCLFSYLLWIGLLSTFFLSCWYSLLCFLRFIVSDYHLLNLFVEDNLFVVV